MIRIHRSDCPQALNNSNSKTAYKIKQVVDTLWEMQNGKCCYCEALIPQTGHTKAVEHFRPRALFKENQNDWDNLLLACGNCNGRKSDKFPVTLCSERHHPAVIYLDKGSKKKKAGNFSPLLIDPSDPSINPETHITFQVNEAEEDHGMAISKNGSAKGDFTIQTLGLSDLFCIRQRLEWHSNLLRFHSSLLDATLSKDPDQINREKNNWERLLSSKKQFAAYARAYARHKKIDKICKISIP